MIRRPRVALIAVGLLAALTATRTRAQSDGTAQIITRSEPFTGAGALPESTAGPRLTLPSGGVPDDMVVVLDEYGPQVVDTQRAQTSPSGNGLLSNNLGLGLFGNQAGGNATAGAAYCGDTQDRQYRFGVFGELLYWQAGDGANIAYAVPTDGVLPTSTPVGNVGTLDFGYEVGFRIGGMLILNEVSAIVGTYTWWDADTSGQVAAAPPLVVRSLLHHPGTVTSQQHIGLSATAQHELKLQMFDLEYERLISAPGICRVSWSAGARYAQLDQDFNMTIQRVAGDSTVTTEIDFQGVGARFGLDADADFGRSGFFGYGKLDGSVLSGRFESQYLQANAFADVLASTGWDEDRLVPIVEYELGLGYSRPIWRVVARATVGYQFAAWFNTLTTQELIRSVQSSQYVGATDTLTFDGIVGRVEVVF